MAVESSPKINLRPGLDNKLLSSCNENCDSGINTMESMSHSMGSMSIDSSVATQQLDGGGQTRLRTLAEQQQYCGGERDEESMGYHSMVESVKPTVFEQPPLAVADVSDEIDIASAEPLPLPTTTLFTTLLQEALRYPEVLKPRELGDPIGEKASSVDEVRAPELPAVNDGPFQENTHMHNYACCGDSTYLLAPFRSALAEQNEDGDSSLHLAIIHAQLPVAEQVATVWRGVPEYLNVQNHLGQTGMHLAIITGQPRLVERLLWAGADPCRRDRNGDTCLHVAAKMGDISSAGLILNVCQRFNLRKETLEARNYGGFTAVHLTVMHGRREMLKYLVATWGADVDAQDYTAGRSPLHIAVEREMIDIASVLTFNLQATVDAPMFDNQTPLHVAAGRCNRGMVALLVAAGAQTDIEDGEGELPADLTYDTQILRLCNA